MKRLVYCFFVNAQIMKSRKWVSFILKGIKYLVIKRGNTTILIRATYENKNATAILTVNVTEK